MFVPFDSISPAARIWIFQSGQKLSETDITIISSQLKLFTEEWEAHGQPLKASFDIRYGHFIILAADEGYNPASGCSIDASVRVVKDIGQTLSYDFFDRNLVAFKKDNQIQLVAIADLKQKYKEGAWNENTTTFNNLVENKKSLQQEWEIPAGNTWLKRYVPNETLAN